ncbi:ATP synthase F0 subunit B [Thermodesulfobacteriota bacterium]
MISINATLFIQLINFILLVFILNRLMFRPILEILSERANHLDEAKSKMTNIEAETEELIKKCLAIEKNARKEAGNESAEFKQDALVASEKIFDDTRIEVSNIRDKVAKEVEKKIEIAKQSLSNEAAQLADVITEKVIGRRIVN